MTITGAFRAVASVTLSIVAAWTRARCPKCNRLVCSFPGEHVLETRPVREPSGRGPVMACQRCSTLLEVIAHG